MENLFDVFKNSYMFRHLHSSERNIWLDAMDTNKFLFRGKSRMEKLGILQHIAKSIKGVGACTIDETLLWIENDEDYI